MLAIEVALTTLAYDRRLKSRLYARHGVQGVLGRGRSRRAHLCPCRPVGRDLGRQPVKSAVRKTNYRHPALPGFAMRLARRLKSPAPYPSLIFSSFANAAFRPEGPSSHRTAWSGWPKSVRHAIADLLSRGDIADPVLNKPGRDDTFRADVAGPETRDGRGDAAWGQGRGRRRLTALDAAKEGAARASSPIASI